MVTFAFFFVSLVLADKIINHGHDEFLDCLRDGVGGSSDSFIHSPQDPKYKYLRQADNLRPLSTSCQRPHLIVTPFHDSHVLAAIYCSKKVGMQIRVRSGGHDYEGLSYTSESPFVIVDMRNLDSISIDVDSKTALVQVGATLGQFYYAIAQKSNTLAFPSGVCPTVGVGGHLSGGGFGMISRKHGLAIDHIVDAKLINADGQILDRSTMGEEVFWAIRGGGGTSFGVFLEFKVTLAPVPETVTYFTVKKTSEVGMKLLHRWQYLADEVDPKLLLRVYVNVVKSPLRKRASISVEFTALYQGPVTDLLALMKEQFPELGLVQQDCVQMSWAESTLVTAGLTGQPLEALVNRTSQGLYAPSYFKGKSDFVTSPIPIKGLRKMWKFLHTVDNAHLLFCPLGGAINAFSQDQTPFPHRKGNKFMIHYGVNWASPNDSQKNIHWIRSLYNFMTPYVTKSPRAAYFNYRDLDIGRDNVSGSTSFDQASVWGYKYFKGNFKRLVQVKTKVDPSNFFRNEQSIPPVAN